MAATWQSASQNVSFAANKSMLDVFNGAASTRFVRVYRAYGFNNGTAAVVGVINTHRIQLVNASSGGTAVVPIAHSTANPVLNANTTSGTGRVFTSTAILRQILTSNDEPTVSTLDWDAMGTLVPFCEFWNAGYGDASVEPILCRAAEARGFAIVSVTQTVGAGDYEISFTDSAA
jgi:hypothetical protein